ncbi:MAG TPA: T9SS type A sorting domain-containing protein, partial [Saprospiraceae bacterium]|nr:T9SS type A sorting domain-containing protein [Saprospiraceae bacterium]
TLDLKRLHDVNHNDAIDEINIFPNPFLESTKIELRMQQPGMVQFTFYDLSGKLIYTYENVFQSGKQQIEIGKKELGSGAGIITCQVVCRTQVVTKKLVMMH